MEETSPDKATKATKMEIDTEMGKPGVPIELEKKVSSALVQGQRKRRRAKENRTARKEATLAKATKAAGEPEQDDERSTV